MSFCGIIANIRVKRYPNVEISFLHWEILLPIFLFTLIFGLRYDVGTDYFNYLKLYQEHYRIDRIEWAFKQLTLLLSNNGVHYSFYFAIISFIQIVLMYYTFKNERYLYPFLVVVLFLGGYFVTWMNILRQTIAALIFFYSLKYVEDKKFFHYLLWCLIGALFHKTALALIVLYPFLKNGKDYFKNIDFQMLFIFIFLILYYSGVSVERLFSFLYESFAAMFNYTNYTLEAALRNIKSGNTGLGYILAVLIDFFIIIHSNKLKEYYNSKRVVIFYNLYYVGVAARVLFAGSIFFSRPFLYFIYVKMIISAYLFYFLYKNLRKPTYLFNFLIFLFLYLMNFIPFIIFGDDYKSTFSFFWQHVN
jgi:hypothetical protein